MTTTLIRARRLAVLTGAALALASLLAGPALSAYGLPWKETAKNGNAPILTFTVSRLTIGKSSWSANVSFANVSQKTITVGNQFGVAFFQDSTATDLSNAAAFAPATKFSHARPVALKPGASWSGVISGTGALSASRPSLYARVVFGPLTGLPGQTSSVFWITDHSKTLPAAGTGAPIPTGPQIVA